MIDLILLVPVRTKSGPLVPEQKMTIAVLICGTDSVQQARVKVSLRGHAVEHSNTACKDPFESKLPNQSSIGSGHEILLSPGLTRGARWNT